MNRLILGKRCFCFNDILPKVDFLTKDIHVLCGFKISEMNFNQAKIACITF